MTDTSHDLVAETVDAEHLRLLAIGHYIVGAICILFSSLFIFHFVFAVSGAWDLAPPNATSQAAKRAAETANHFFAVFSALVVLSGWALGGLVILTGRWIARRVHHTPTIVVACVNIALVPLGSILGVFTLIVLLRPSVKRMYAH